MCLEIIATISPSSKTRVSAKRLSKVSGLVISSTKSEGRSSLHFSLSGGCSCEFLAEKYYPENPLWNLAPSHLFRLADAVEFLGKNTEGFSLLVHWLNGEVQRTESDITLQDLLKAIKDNCIGNNVLYHIGKK